MVCYQICIVLHFYIPSTISKIRHKSWFPKFPVINFYMLPKTTQTWIITLLAKITILTCVHTLYKNTNINRKAWCQNTSLTCVNTLYTNTNINKKAHCQNIQCYTWTYPLQQHKQTRKGTLPKLPVLHVYRTSLTI